MRGHADVREFIGSTLRGFPDLRFEIVDGPFIQADEAKAAFYWKGSATHTGPIDPPGLAPTGRRIEMEGGDFHEYRDGRLVRLRIVFDLADTMRQLGVLPEPGTRAERLTMRLANVQNKFRRRA
jgi:predicted ester cyclase